MSYKYRLGTEWESIEPLVTNGEVFFDYGVHKETGTIYSFKHGRKKKIKLNYNRGKKGTKNSEKNYARFCMSINGKRHNKLVHRVVAETLIPLDELNPPAGMSKAGWAQAGDEARAVIKSLLVVDHKDNDPTNYHPTNLRWATPKENAKYYQEEQKHLD